MLNSGIYWDDWLLLFRKAGEGLSAPDPRMFIYDLLNQTPNPILGYRIISFLALGIGMIAWYYSLKKIIHPEIAFVLSLGYILLPLNNARIAAINLPYAISEGINAFAFLLLLNRKILLSVPLFILSFITPAYYVWMYAELLIAFLYFRYTTSKSFHPIVWLGLFCLPIVGWIIRGEYFNPIGNYAAYYAVTPERILNAFLRIPVVVVKQFLGLGLEIWRLITPFSILLFVSFYFLFPIPIQYKGIWTKYLGGIGILLMGVAVFPYLVLGLEPSFTDWNSRHQLLLPIGMSAVITWVFLIINKTKGRIISLGLLALLCSTVISQQIEWFQDEQKQNKVIMWMKNHEKEIKPGVIVIADKSQISFAANRKLRFYELTGMWNRISTNQNMWICWNSCNQFPDSSFYTSLYYLKNYSGGKYQTKIFP